VKTVSAWLWGMALLSLALPLRADDDPDKAAQALTPYLAEAHVFGAWSKGAQHGDIRYAMLRGGIEEVETKLYIQWISDETEESPKKLVASVSIGLVPGVFDPPKLLSSHPYILHVEIKSMHCEETQLYDIEITGVGQYKLKSLNKKRCDPTADQEP
jgi:hypothetical protein